MSPAEQIRVALRRLRRRGIRRRGSLRAVLAVTVVADGPAVLLTRRIDALSANPGQLALPGGLIDRWESAPGAARSRLADNLGIVLPTGSVLGLLDDYLTHRAHREVVITPVVLWAGHRIPASDVLAVPFVELDVEPMFVANAESDRSVIRLPLHGEWLHAPTAAVLHQFREVVLHHRRTRVAHLAPIPHSAR